MKKIIIKNLVISIIFVLVLCLCSIYNFTVASDTDTLIWVDTPTQNQSVEKGKLDIQGWMLSEYEGANIQPGKYTPRTSWRRSSRCPGRRTRTWNIPSRHR